MGFLFISRCLKSIKVSERRKMIRSFIFRSCNLINEDVFRASLESFWLIFEVKYLKWFFLNFLVEFWNFEIPFPIVWFLFIQLINNCIEIFFEFKLFFQHYSVFIFLLLQQIFNLLISFFFLKTFECMRIVNLNVVFLLIRWL